MLGDVWDWIAEKTGESWETFLGYFSNLNEFSTPGLVGGIICMGFIFFVRGKLLNPFIKAMPVAQGVITYIICFAGAFIVGYLFMKRAFEQ
ncbi:MAG: hypothetical protein ABSG05_03410 [Candidatus Pacearchaeota archaeon]